MRRSDGGCEEVSLRLAGRRLRLVCYQQGLVTAGLDGLYGREILTRAWDVDSGEAVSPGWLFGALKREPDKLLQQTRNQIETVTLLAERAGVVGSLWFNLAAELLQVDALFEALLSDCLLRLPAAWRGRLVLEVSEDALAGHLVAERVGALRKRGFLVAMDDFGAGYSNLGRLQLGGFDILKLDLALLRQVPERIWAANAYREVVNLAASGGGLVVAEGVERRCQSDFVRWAGVDIIQGFLYARPQPWSALTDAAVQPIPACRASQPATCAAGSGRA